MFSGPQDWLAEGDREVAELIAAQKRRQLETLCLISSEHHVSAAVLAASGGALREGHERYVVVDATASPIRAAHDAAIQRMILAGVTPVTWYSLAAESQLDPASTTRTFAPG